MSPASKFKQIYICTKPLQMMIAMILNEQALESNLYITDSFHSAKNFLHSPPLRQRFSDIRFFSNRNEAILFAAKQKPAAIFIDSDIGLKTQFTLLAAKFLSPTTSIQVYEEGIGTYRTDLITSRLKYLLYKLTGTARHFGGSIFSKKIWVFDPVLFSSKLPHLKYKIKKIEPSLIDWIRNHKSEIIDIFLPKNEILYPNSSNVAYLYLSSWMIDHETLAAMNTLDNVFIKPHPHIQDDLIRIEKKGTAATWIPSSCPAEVIILLLCNYYKVVYVKHNNSSAVMYMRCLNNLVEFDEHINKTSIVLFNVGAK